jgi:hypothetical protein
MAIGKEPPQQVEMTSPLDIEAIATHQSEIHHLNEKVFDGDEALKVLHTHYEPYSPEEEKSLLRKIDYRMCTLMLIISKNFFFILTSSANRFSPMDRRTPVHRQELPHSRSDLRNYR